MHLSIIIPVYNEADVITTTLDRLRDTPMPEFVESMEVIIVDDCSTDGSAELIEDYQATNFVTKLIRLPDNCGKGAAVAAGVRISTGDTILIQDADLELNPADIPALLEMMHRKNLDIVSGTRFRSGQQYPRSCLPGNNSEQDLFICCVADHRKENNGHHMRI